MGSCLLWYDFLVSFRELFECFGFVYAGIFDNGTEFVMVYVV